MSGFSFARLVALLRKEWIQVIARRDDAAHHRRDSDHAAFPVRLRHQFQPEEPADRAAVDRRLANTCARSPRRSTIPAITKSRTLRSEAEAEDGARARRSACSSSSSRRSFDRAVDRGETPAMLMDADATDPTRDRQRGRRAWTKPSASLNRDLPPIRQAQPQVAAVPVRGPRPLQSRAIDRAQHRAGPDLHRADVLDAVRDHARHHPRARARHDGKPARDAGPADRGDDRQDRALCRDRLHPGRA